jgi:hypothetical protein
MSPRALRRAAERETLKAARKEQKAQSGTVPDNPVAPNAVAESPVAAPVAPAPEPKVASAAQFAANRANAQFSTGPVSSEGRAISSRNHTQHGLTATLSGGPFKVMAGENQSEYEAAHAAFAAEWKPATATETDLVERLAIHYWLRRRASRLQDERLALGMNEMKDYRQFEVYARYYSMHLRAFNKAFADLLRLRSFQMRQRKDEALLERRAQEMQIRFESQKRKAEEHAAKMEAIRLKQEAAKQRNQSAKVTKNAAPIVETPLAQSA